MTIRCHRDGSFFYAIENCILLYKQELFPNTKLQVINPEGKEIAAIINSSGTYYYRRKGD